MQFSVHVIALAASILPVISAVQLLDSNYNGITAGKTFTLSWNGDGTPVDIILESGPSGNLVPVGGPLASGVLGTSTTVTIPQVVSGTYAFAIKQSGTTNYSPQFPIAGTAAAASSSSSSSSLAAAAASSSSSITTSTTIPGASAAAAVSQISDGQIQAGSAAAATSAAYALPSGNVSYASPSGTGVGSAQSFLGAAPRMVNVAAGGVVATAAAAIVGVLISL